MNHASETSGAAKNAKDAGWKGSPRWLRAIWVSLLFAGSILAVALIVLLYIGAPREQGYVNKDDEQAVLLQNGKVYFGKIHTVNKEYVELQQVFYYPNASAPADLETPQHTISVVKMGCEPHAPTDRMVINHDQIVYWENLQPNGQVSKAIQQWITQNPNGQQCALQTTSSTN